MIQLKEVTKEYGRNIILKDVNLEIAEGDIYGIIGQSGSGKTTLLNLITGFTKPSEGEVSYYSNVTNETRNLTKDLPKIKKNLGFTPQHYSFYPKLTTIENLMHFGQLYKLKKQTLKNNAKALLQFTKLSQHEHKLAENLSEGMKRRLDLACSLIHKPKLLALDEPTADLDPLLQKEILNLLQEVNKQGVTIVIASHHLESIEDVCNKVAIIRNKQVHSHGLIEDVKKPFLQEHFTISLRPGSNKEKIISSLQTFAVKKIVENGNKVVIYPQDLEKTLGNILQLIKEENIQINNVHLSDPSLNEVFEEIILHQ